MHYRVQQISDTVMKGVLSPSPKPLAPLAPGCGPSEWGCPASGGQLQSRATNRGGGGLEQEAFLSQQCDSPPPNSCRNSSGCISACSSPFGQVGFFSRWLGLELIYMELSHSCPATHVHVRQCQEAKTARQLAVPAQQADVLSLRMSYLRVPDDTTADILFAVNKQCPDLMACLALRVTPPKGSKLQKIKDF